MRWSACGSRKIDTRLELYPQDIMAIGQRGGQGGIARLAE